LWVILWARTYTIHYEAINTKTLNNEAVFSSETLAATCWNTPCPIDTETCNIPKVFEFFFSVLAGQLWDIYHLSVGTLSLPYTFKNDRGT